MRDAELGRFWWQGSSAYTNSKCSSLLLVNEVQKLQIYKAKVARVSAHSVSSAAPGWQVPPRMRCHQPHDAAVVPKFHEHRLGRNHWWFLRAFFKQSCFQSPRKHLRANTLDGVLITQVKLLRLAVRRFHHPRLTYAAAPYGVASDQWSCESSNWGC